jgi:hypothetical protein
VESGVTDLLQPTPIADAVKRAIADALHAVPAGKRGALLVLVDDQGARAMVAAKFGNGRWKVAAGTAVAWHGPVSGSVAIAGAW